MYWKERTFPTKGLPGLHNHLHSSGYFTMETEFFTFLILSFFLFSHSETKKFSSLILNSGNVCLHLSRISSAWPSFLEFHLELRKPWRLTSEGMTRRIWRHTKTFWNKRHWYKSKYSNFSCHVTSCFLMYCSWSY